MRVKNKTFCYKNLQFFFSRYILISFSLPLFWSAFDIVRSQAKKFRLFLFLFLFFSVRFKKCTHDICIHGSPDTNEIQTESLRRKKNAPNKTAKDKWGKQALSAFQRNKFSFLCFVFHLFFCVSLLCILIWCWQFHCWTWLKLASYRHKGYNLATFSCHWKDNIWVNLK